MDDPVQLETMDLLEQGGASRAATHCKEHSKQLPPYSSVVAKRLFSDGERSAAACAPPDGSQYSRIYEPC